MMFRNMWPRTMFIHVRKKVFNYDSVSAEKGQNLCFMFYIVTTLRFFLKFKNPS